MNERDVTELRARLTEMENELQKLKGQRSKARLSTIVMLGLVVVVATMGSALAANGNCPNGLPFCFAANAPAKASEVNHNFAQVKEWIEGKVGPVGAAVSVPSAAAFANNVSVTGSVGSATLSTSGNTTIGGTLQVNNGTNLYNGLNVVSGLSIVNGIQVSCINGLAGNTFPICCTINVRTGATACRATSSWTGGVWSAVTAPFASTGVDGHFSLSCFEGLSGQNYPTCCRSNDAGWVQCRVAQNWQLSSWYDISTAF